MLVKRKNPLSGVLDPHAEDESEETLWPDDEALPPTLEPSGYRAAPSRFHAPSGSSEVSEADADASALPTPRELCWNPYEPDEESPLPVVTAATEPTQRGLGIPPPPSSREAAWFAELPSLASAAPPSLEAFAERAVPEHRGSSESAREPGENERITVRAPGQSASKLSRRRRAVVVALLAAATFAGVAVQRATTRLDDMSSATPTPARTTALHVVSLIEDGRQPPAGAAPSEAAPNTGVPGVSQDPAATTPRRDRSEKEARRERTRRKAHDALMRTSPLAEVPANSDRHADTTTSAAKPRPPDYHPALSLPPR